MGEIHCTYAVYCNDCGLFYSSIFEGETTRVMTEHPHTNLETHSTVHENDHTEMVAWPN